MLGLPFPEEHGGIGADLLTINLAVEQIARACATSSLILIVQVLGSLPIQIGGSEEQKARWFPRLASGEMLAAFALTEPEAGSDVAGDADASRPRRRRVRARRRRSGPSPTAASRGCSRSSRLRTRGGRRHERLTCFGVEVPTDGFAVARLEHKMGIRGSPTAELAFMAFASRSRTGSARRARAGRSRWGRSIDRTGVAAQAVGIAQGALEAAAAYARDRSSSASASATSRWSEPCSPTWTPGPRPPGSSCTRPASRSRRTRRTPPAGRRSRSSSRATPRWRVTTDAVQVFGGYGYTEDFPVERMMRDAKITQLYEGTQQMQRLVIARALLGRE